MGVAIGSFHAFGIVRMGLYASAKELHGYPITPGFELSGVVTAIGTKVSDHAVGDEVLALTLFVWICVGIVYVSGLVLGRHHRATTNTTAVRAGTTNVPEAAL